MHQILTALNALRGLHTATEFLTSVAYGDVAFLWCLVTALCQGIRCSETTQKCNELSVCDVRRVLLQKCRLR